MLAKVAFAASLLVWATAVPISDDSGYTKRDVNSDGVMCPKGFDGYLCIHKCSKYFYDCGLEGEPLSQIADDDETVCNDGELVPEESCQNVEMHISEDNKTSETDVDVFEPEEDGQDDEMEDDGTSEDSLSKKRMTASNCLGVRTIPPSRYGLPTGLGGTTCCAAFFDEELYSRPCQGEWNNVCMVDGTINKRNCVGPNTCPGQPTQIQTRIIWRDENEYQCPNGARSCTFGISRTVSRKVDYTWSLTATRASPINIFKLFGIDIKADFKYNVDSTATMTTQDTITVAPGTRWRPRIFSRFRCEQRVCNGAVRIRGKRQRLPVVGTAFRGVCSYKNQQLIFRGDVQKQRPTYTWDCVAGCNKARLVRGGRRTGRA